MALTSSQQALKDAILGKAGSSAIASAEGAAMRSGWESMNQDEQTALRNSGTAQYDWNRGTQAMPVVDPYEEIRRQQAALLAAQKQARIDALSGAKQSALSALSAEESTVAPAYLKQRAGLDTQAQLASRRTNESLAARGLASSGSAAQSDLARQVALQQGMTSINEAEAGTMANIAQRRTAAEQAYAQGVAQAESEAAATAAQNEINRLMQAQQSQEAAGATAATQQFEAQKLAQEQANKLQIEQLKVSAQEAQAQGDFARAQELAKYKADLENEQIKLRASISASSGGGGSTSTGSALKLSSTQQKLADAIAKNITSSPGNMITILNGVSDPAVKAYLVQIFGAQATNLKPTDYSNYNLTRQMNVPGL